MQRCAIINLSCDFVKGIFTAETREKTARCDVIKKRGHMPPFFELPGIVIAVPAHARSRLACLIGEWMPLRKLAERVALNLRGLSDNSELDIPA